MSDLLVTADDLGVPDVVCECGHAADFHPGGPHDDETGWHADWSQHLAGEQCPCRKAKDGVRLAHLDSIVRREVEKARKQMLQEVASVVRHKADVAEAEDGGKLRTWDAYISVVDWCTDRIEREGQR